MNSGIAVKIAYQNGSQTLFMRRIVPALPRVGDKMRLTINNMGVTVEVEDVYFHEVAVPDETGFTDVPMSITLYVHDDT